MVADAGGHAGGHLGGGDLHDAVAEGRALPGGHGDAHEGQENAVGAQHLTELLLPHIQRVDLIIVDDGPQPGAGQGHLRLRVLALQIVDVEGAGQRVLPEVAQPQQRRKGHAPHPAPEGALLRVEAIGPHPLVAHEVEGLVLFDVVGLLKHGDVVRAALVEIAVLVGVDGVDLQPHHAEVLPGQLAGLADVFHTALGPALAGQEQDLLHAGVGDDLHFLFDLLHGELHAPDVVVAVEAAVHAVIFAVVGDVKGREEIHRVAEVAAGLHPGPLGHFLQKGLRRRGQEGLEVLQRAGLVLQRRPHVPGGVGGAVVAVHLLHDLPADVRFDLLHAGQVLHGVFAAGRVVFQTVLFRQRRLRQVF